MLSSSLTKILIERNEAMQVMKDLVSSKELTAKVSRVDDNLADKISYITVRFSVSKNNDPVFVSKQLVNIFNALDIADYFKSCCEYLKSISVDPEKNSIDVTFATDIQLPPDVKQDQLNAAFKLFDIELDFSLD